MKRDWADTLGMVVSFGMLACMTLITVSIGLEIYTMPR
jgi:hypothetical protein